MIGCCAIQYVGDYHHPWIGKLYYSTDLTSTMERQRILNTAHLPSSIPCLKSGSIGLSRRSMFRWGNYSIMNGIRDAPKSQTNSIWWWVKNSEQTFWGMNNRYSVVVNSRVPGFDLQIQRDVPGWKLGSFLHGTSIMSWPGHSLRPLFLIIFPMKPRSFHMLVYLCLPHDVNGWINGISPTLGEDKSRVDLLSAKLVATWNKT